MRNVYDIKSLSKRQDRQIYINGNERSILLIVNMIGSKVSKWEKLMKHIYLSI